MASFNVNNATTTTIEILITDAAGMYFRVFVYENGDTSSSDLGNGIKYANATTVLDTVEGLTPGTMYLISVYVGTDANLSNPEHLGTDEVYTEEEQEEEIPDLTATYSVSSVGTASFVVNVSNVSAGASYWRYFRVFVKDPDGTLVVDEGYQHHAIDFDYTVSGLSPNTTYTISVVAAADTAGTNADYLSGPSLVKTNMSAWSWTYSNGSATAAQTKAAYAAVTENGALSDFSYKVWNDLCDKVKECIDRAGSSWWTVMGPDGAETPGYSATRMTSSDKELTADRFNAIRGNIGGRVSTGIDPVYPGDEVNGWYFETITDCLNTWIANLNA